MKRSMRVLISGAGIAGPTLAWFLARTGARITLVEKAHDLLPHGQSIDFQGSAIKVIKKMGLLDEVRRHNTTEKGGIFIDPKGRPFAPFPVGDGSVPSPTNEFEILRGDLSKILYEATKEHPGIDYLFSTTVKQVLSNNDDSVKVELSNGNVHDFDLLVVADGQWSRLRKQNFPADSIQVIDRGMIAVYWTIPRLPSDNDWWSIYQALDRRIITLRPDPHGTTRAMFTCMPQTPSQKQAWDDAARSGREAQEALLHREFADAGWQAPRLLDTLTSAPDFYFHMIQQIKMARWSNARIVCLGDTAYAPSPLTGGGTSLALIGAYVLAGELSKLNPADHPATALDSYEAAFHPYVDEVQKIPSFFPGIAHPRTAWQRWLFATCASVTSRIVTTPWIARRISARADQQEDDFPLPDYEYLVEAGHDEKVLG